MKRRRPAKHKDMLSMARECIRQGRYRDTRHATDRKSERVISLVEITSVINSGYHEKSKDEFKPEYDAWNYAIRGKTVDKRSLRVAVSFDEQLMLIITAIDLDV